MRRVLERAIQFGFFAALSIFVFVSGFFTNSDAQDSSNLTTISGDEAAKERLSLFSTPFSTPIAHAEDTGCGCSASSDSSDEGTC